MCSHTIYTPPQSMPTNNNKMCQIENCRGEQTKVCFNTLHMYFINAPHKQMTQCVLWFIEFEGLERERERKRERVCVCVMYT